MSGATRELDATRTHDAHVGAGTVLAALPFVVVVLDRNDRLAFANTAAEEFFATCCPRLSAARLTDFVGEDSPLAEAIATVRREEGVVTLHDVALESPRLARSSVDATLAPLPELKGAIVLSLAPVRKRDPDEREGASRELMGMAELLAHEVKNPLSGIRGAAQLLESSLDGEGRELAVLIRGEVDRIDSLVDRIAPLNDARTEKVAVNIHEVLRHVRVLAERGFAARIRFREIYDPSLPPALGNRDQLVQVFLNLVKNAAEAMGERNGEIVLASGFHPEAWRRTGDRRRHVPIMVAVRDNGPGIPEAERAFLFVPRVSKKPDGGGLGLAVVAKIVDEHGGLIEVESRPSGTELRVYLPLAEEATPA